MALGKAFIEIHADTRPFARELGRELGRILAAVDAGPARRIGRRLGDSIVDGVGESVEGGRDRIRRGLSRTLDPGGVASVITRFTSSIIDTIDDGLSGLPGEIKAAIAAILIAVSPIIGAGIAGAISGGVILGFAAIGTLIASQFSIVSDEFEILVSDMRALFLDLGDVFVIPVLSAMSTIREEFTELGPAFERVFALASTFIEPVVDAFIVFIETLLPHLEETLRNVHAFLPDMVDSFEILAESVGIFLTTVTGADDAGKGLKTLTFIVGTLLVSLGYLIRVLTEIFGLFNKIFLLINDKPALIRELFGDGTDEADKFAKKNLELANATDLAVNALKSEEEALIAQQAAMAGASQALEEYVQTTLGAWDANISFEQSLDDMSEQLRKHRGNLDLNTQAGRDNQESIKKGVADLIRQREETIKLTGDTDKANRVFETNRIRLENAATAAGISRQRFRELTAEILAVPPVSENVIPLALLARLAEALRLAKGIKGAFALAVIGTAIASRGRVPGFADGTIATKPTLGVFGEAGPEAVIPLNKPARAAQLMNQSGLSSMMSPQVNVYIGNRQLDPYIDVRTNQRMAATARDLSYGSRRI